MSRTETHDFRGLATTQLDGTVEYTSLPRRRAFPPVRGLAEFGSALLLGMGNAVSALAHNAKRADNGAEMPSRRSMAHRKS